VIPADNIDRAKKIYTALLGGKIEPTTTLYPASAAVFQYQQISTDPAQQGTMNTRRRSRSKTPPPLFLPTCSPTRQPIACWKEHKRTYWMTVGRMLKNDLFYGE